MNRNRYAGRVRGRKKGEPQGPNKTELAYGKLLEEQMKDGAIIEYGYEGIKLRLADNTFYTPDYYVITHDLELELHEVKSARKDKKSGTYKPFYEQAARVKIKVAADKYPYFRFVAMAKAPTGWIREEF